MYTLTFLSLDDPHSIKHITFSKAYFISYLFSISISEKNDLIQLTQKIKYLLKSNKHSRTKNWLKMLVGSPSIQKALTFAMLK